MARAGLAATQQTVTAVEMAGFVGQPEHHRCA